MRLPILFLTGLTALSCTSEPTPKKADDSQQIFVVYEEPANTDYEIAYAKIEEFGKENADIEDCKSNPGYTICHVIYQKGVSQQIAPAVLPPELVGKALKMQVMLLKPDPNKPTSDSGKPNYIIAAQTKADDTNCPSKDGVRTSSANEQVSVKLCSTNGTTSVQTATTEKPTYKICGDNEVCSLDSSGNPTPFEEALQGLCMKNSKDEQDKNLNTQTDVCKGKELKDGEGGTKGIRWGQSFFCWMWSLAESDESNKNEASSFTSRRDTSICEKK